MVIQNVVTGNKIRSLFRHKSKKAFIFYKIIKGKLNETIKLLPLVLALSACQSVSVKSMQGETAYAINDKDGTISIALGAYGIPVTYIIDKNQIILKQFVGALNDQSLKEIKSLLK